MLLAAAVGRDIETDEDEARQLAGFILLVDVFGDIAAIKQGLTSPK